MSKCYYCQSVLVSQIIIDGVNRQADIKSIFIFILLTSMQTQQDSKRSLKLNFFGNVRTLSCDSSFKVEELEQFCTLGEVFQSGEEIYVRVQGLKKTYSELCSKLERTQA